VKRKETLLTQKFHDEIVTKCFLFNNGKQLASSSFDGRFQVITLLIDMNKY